MESLWSDLSPLAKFIIVIVIGTFSKITLDSLNMPKTKGMMIFQIIVMVFIASIAVWIGSMR